MKIQTTLYFLLLINILFTGAQTAKGAIIYIRLTHYKSTNQTNVTALLELQRPFDEEYDRLVKQKEEQKDIVLKRKIEEKGYSVLRKKRNKTLEFLEQSDFIFQHTFNIVPGKAFKTTKQHNGKEMVFKGKTIPTNLIYASSKGRYYITANIFYSYGGFSSTLTNTSISEGKKILLGVVTNITGYEMVVQEAILKY